MPDRLGSIPREGMGEDDVGTSSEREVRRLISRIYRVGGRYEDGSHVLSDRDFDAYLAAAKRYINPEHFAVFELTARAVRTGVLDSQTAATRLAAYYAPATIGETSAKLRGLEFRALPASDPDFEERKARSAKSSAWWRRKRRAMKQLRRMRERKGIIYESQPATKLFRS